MKKNLYPFIVAFIAVISISFFNQLHAQSEVYWREGFPRAGGSTFPTSTAGVSTTPAYYRSGSGLGWYTFGAYNANASQNCTANDNTIDHLRILGAAVDSGYIVTPTVDYGINEFHFLRTRTNKRFTLYKTIDTVASTTNWVKVAFIVGSVYNVCTDTAIIVNDLTARRLKLVIRQGEDTDIDSIWLTSMVPIVLPISFDGVNAVHSNGNIKISWNIETEINTLRYEIEKSSDGRGFTSIGSVNAVNSRRYSWIDNNVSAGDIYYRIKGVDKDGSFMYSNIVRINSNKKLPELTVMPNPIQGGNLNIQLNNFEKGIFTVSMYNGSGQQSFTIKINNEVGASSKTIHLPSSVKPGVYMLQLVNGKTKISRSVIVE